MFEGSNPVTKSDVIAACLINSGFVKSKEEALVRIRNIFIEEFPDSSFDKWNSIFPDVAAENIISNVGRASRINVLKFIEDLWD